MGYRLWRDLSNNIVENGGSLPTNEGSSGKGETTIYMKNNKSYTYTIYNNHVYHFDVSENTWRKLTLSNDVKPSNKKLFSMSSYNNKIILHGGQTSSNNIRSFKNIQIKDTSIGASDIWKRNLRPYQDLSNIYQWAPPKPNEYLYFVKKDGELISKLKITRVDDFTLINNDIETITSSTQYSAYIHNIERKVTIDGNQIYNILQYSSQEVWISISKEGTYSNSNGIARYTYDGILGEYIQIKFKTSILLAKIRLTTHGVAYNASWEGYMYSIEQEIKIAGSNDGSTWTIIYEKNNIALDSGIREYHVNSDTAYMYIRIICPKNHGYGATWANYWGAHLLECFSYY